MHIVCPTGMAAQPFRQCGSTTIHTSFAMKWTTEPLFTIWNRLRTKDALMKKWQQCDILCIDECSMVNAATLNYMDSLLRLIRKEPDRAFGGVILLLSGDVLQLPPVTGAFFWMSYAFHHFVLSQPQWIECVHNYRCRTDPGWYEILLYLRQGIVPLQRIMQHPHAPRICFPPTVTLREPSVGPLAPVFPVLTATCSVVTHWNSKMIPSIASIVRNPLEVYHRNEREQWVRAVDISKRQLGMIAERNNLAVDLPMGVGMPVMITRNLNALLVNGSTGTLAHIEPDKVIVEVDDQWHELKLSECMYAVEGSAHGRWLRQYPFQMAWAMTVHKAQGMTLSHMTWDAGEHSSQTSFASGTFPSFDPIHHPFPAGQTYVALSRVRQVSQLTVMHASLRTLLEAVQVNPEARSFDRWLHGKCNGLPGTSLFYEPRSDGGASDTPMESMLHDTTLERYSTHINHALEDVPVNLVFYRKTRHIFPWTKTIFFDLETCPDASFTPPRHIAYSCNYEVYANYPKPSEQGMFLRGRPDGTTHSKEVLIDLLSDHPAVQQDAAHTVTVVPDVMEAFVNVLLEKMQEMVRTYHENVKQHKEQEAFRNARFPTESRKSLQHRAACLWNDRPWTLCAFNGGNFDFHFLMQMFHRNGLREQYDVRYVTKGRKLMFLEIRELTTNLVVLRIHDIFHLFSDSLANLCKDFCGGMQLKGEFPHDYVANHGWESVWTSEARVRLDEFPPNAREAVRKNHAPDRFEDGGTILRFPMLASLVRYGASDITAMVQLYFAVDDLFQRSGVIRTHLLEQYTGPTTLSTEYMRSWQKNHQRLGLVRTSAMHFLTIRQVAMYALFVLHLPRILLGPVHFPTGSLSTTRSTARRPGARSTKLFRWTRQEDQDVRKAVFGGHCGPNIRGFISEEVALYFPDEFKHYQTTQTIDALWNAILRMPKDVSWYERCTDYLQMSDECSLYPAAMILLQLPYGIPEWIQAPVVPDPETEIDPEGDSDPFHTAPYNVNPRWATYERFFMQYNTTPVHPSDRPNPYGWRSSAPHGMMHFIVEFEGTGNLHDVTPGTGVRLDGRLRWSHRRAVRTYTDLDWWLFVRSKGIVHRVIRICIWTSSHPWMRGCMETMKQIKDEGEAKGETAKRNGGKILLNTAYGMTLMKEFGTDNALVTSTKELKQFYDTHTQVQELIVQAATSTEDDSEEGSRNATILLKGIRSEMEQESGWISTLPHVGAYVLSGSHWIYEQVADVINPFRDSLTPEAALLQPFYSDTDSFVIHASALVRLWYGGQINTNQVFGRLQDDLGMRISKGGSKDWLELSEDKRMVRLHPSKILMGFFVAPKCYTLLYMLPDGSVKWKLRVAGVPTSQLELQWDSKTYDHLPPTVLVNAFLRSRLRGDVHLKPKDFKALSSEEANQLGMIPMTLTKRIRKVGDVRPPTTELPSSTSPEETTSALWQIVNRDLHRTLLKSKSLGVRRILWDNIADRWLDVTIPIDCPWPAEGEILPTSASLWFHLPNSHSHQVASLHQWSPVDKILRPFEESYLPYESAY